MCKNDQPLVSIVMPSFNSEKYIQAAIDSVTSQTYNNWELLVVDDGSNDNTSKIVMDYCENDTRIKLFKFYTNKGTAKARNVGVANSSGKYVAFLDSDDIWSPKKLQKQIAFMENNSYDFTCTNYSKIDRCGKFLNKVIYARKQSDYSDILKKNPGNSTVIFNLETVGKIQIPDIRKRNDYVMWLQVIKKVKTLYGLNETLSSHRIRKGSLSKNKVSLIKYHWVVYRNIEKLSVIYSLYLLIYWIVIAIFK